MANTKKTEFNTVLNPTTGVSWGARGHVPNS